ncbi:serine/threonine-protein kinase dbf2 [Hypoxylon texense]
MKASTVAAVLAPSAASAQWWRGAPSCAQSCLSTAWSSPTGTVTSGWPAQSEYCAADAGSSVGSCISSACESASSATAYESYSQLSSSLCSQYAACTSAGSTGVRTITYPGGPVTWAAPGGWGSRAFVGGPPGGGNDGISSWISSKAANLTATAASEYRQYWSEWASAFSSSRTWTGGVATVTGCAFDGSPWFVGPGCGWNGLGGFNGWVGWGAGWSWGPTSTETVTYTTTDSAGATTTGTGLAAVALAVSGTLTTSTTLGAPSATESSESGAAGGAAAAAMIGARGAEGSVVTGMMGVALGAIVLIAGML